MADHIVRQSRRGAAALLLVTAGVLAAAPAPAQERGPASAGTDPRVGLRAGYLDAGTAIRNLRMVSTTPRPQGFYNPANTGDFGFSNTDLAFRGNLLFVGSYAGFQVWDVSNPAAPRPVTLFPCPGGQGDVSVYGNLLFMSVEETRGRVDCGTQPIQGASSPERFRGVRIFDISDLQRPRQIAAIQTCRGSHTHTLVTDPRDPANLYVYVSGTSGVRPATELAGCSNLPPDQDPNTSYFRIEVIRVPLAAPQTAAVVGAPRVFADPRTGNIAGLWRGGNHGQGTQNTSQTNQCHDITAYPAIGLAGGACSGNGILLDITNPANPVRVDEVLDTNFAYWHSATFNNAGTSVVFTDEWGGGTQARCRATDRPEWGANAIFRLNGRELSHASYYKIPAPQAATENCVAHNGTLIPVPGRDIMVQAWYQGGISVFDFTDPARPVEIAFFDRGPLPGDELSIGGYWSTAWYNGMIYGTEIQRGIDVFELTPSEHLTQNEIDAAKLVRWEQLNPQLQERITWPAAFPVAKAYVDQLVRNQGLPRARTTAIMQALTRAERATGAARRNALTQLATALDRDARTARDGERVRMLASTVRELAAAR